MIFKKLHFALLTVAIFTFSCRESKKVDNTKSTLPETEQVSRKPIEIFGIEGENIPIRVGPSKKFAKKINEKMTSSLGTTEYCEVDYSVKVKVLEVKGDWSKIQIVEPDWLTDSHIGWIPTKAIKTGKEKVIDFELKQSDYEIFRTNHNSNVQNFDVLIKHTKFDKEYLYQFTKQFRSKKCTMGCNVNLYDSKAIINLLGVYPLNKDQYLKIADHYLSMSTFDAVEIRSWYPYQDFQYKEYGGKNWKKEPIK
jgi:hypothetical protein